MKEYKGKSAKSYKQSSGKQILLLPAVQQQIPQVEKGKLLDVGCGTGDLFSMATEKGYQYFGIDLMSDMLDQAKSNHPEGTFIQANATDFASTFTQRFEVVLSLMMFPCFDDLSMVTKSLVEMKNVLAVNGKIILGLAHPCFDPYMQKYLFKRKDTVADFKGYFSSGDKFVIHKEFVDGIVSFEDHHWLISDYIKAINEAGLKLTALDECEPQNSQQIEWDSTFTKLRLLIPTYMVIVCER